MRFLSFGCPARYTMHTSVYFYLYYETISLFLALSFQNLFFAEAKCYAQQFFTRQWFLFIYNNFFYVFLFFFVCCVCSFSLNFICLFFYSFFPLFVLSEIVFSYVRLFMLIAKLNPVNNAICLAAFPIYIKLDRFSVVRTIMIFSTRDIIVVTAPSNLNDMHKIQAISSYASSFDFFILLFFRCLILNSQRIRFLWNRAIRVSLQLFQFL